jgi:hypothetical protein
MFQINYDFFRQRATGTRAKGPAGVAVNRQDRPLSDSNQQQQGRELRIGEKQRKQKTRKRVTCTTSQHRRVPSSSSTYCVCRILHV